MDGETLLVYAIRSGHTKLAKVLLEAGVDIKKALKQKDDGTLVHIREHGVDDIENELCILWDKYACQ